MNRNSSGFLKRLTFFFRLFLFFVFLLPVACSSGSSGTDPDPDPDPNSNPNPQNPSERNLVVLYTSDEHGWLLQAPGTEGAAKLMGLWRTVEQFSEDGHFLILSGGNSWTGPSISTWFEGASTVAVMNAMAYDGAVIGNHEFDYGVGVLRTRESEAAFPFLSANIRLKATGSPPDFATPYTIRNVNGVRVGVVGLTTTSAPSTSFPAHVEDYDFIPYTDALNEYVPQVWAAGADLVLVVGNICQNEVNEVFPTARQLGVSMIGGGHCREAYSEVREGVALVLPGWQFAQYGKVTIHLRIGPLQVLSTQAEVKSNLGGSPDPEVEVIVEHWAHEAEVELSDVVGHVTEPIPNRSNALHNLVTDAWLFAYPTADIAMLNQGAIRDGIPAGDILKGTIVSIMPFPNNLVNLELTGAEVVDCLAPGTILAGMSAVGGYFHADGSPLKMDSVYHVLTTDFMYGDAANNYRLYDEAPFETGIVYYQPTLTYLEALQTSQDNPLDPFLDHTARR
jgi:2',3'-cyclic-nucleotide 2'-phosphodiesterase (5'-nucleotidase family)